MANPIETNDSNERQIANSASTAAISGDERMKLYANMKQLPTTSDSAQKYLPDAGFDTETKPSANSSDGTAGQAETGKKAAEEIIRLKKKEESNSESNSEGKPGAGGSADSGKALNGNDAAEPIEHLKKLPGGAGGGHKGESEASKAEQLQCPGSNGHDDVNQFLQGSKGKEGKPQEQIGTTHKGESKHLMEELGKPATQTGKGSGEMSDSQRRMMINESHQKPVNPNQVLQQVK